MPEIFDSVRALNDDEDSLSNDIDFFSNHAGSVWVTGNLLYWLRINNDSSDEYTEGKCVNFPAADAVPPLANKS